MPVHVELTLEEEETEFMQEIVANSCANGPEVAELEAKNNEAAAEKPTPSTAEMRSILHCLRIGLERRGFEQMQTFEVFDSNVRSLLRQNPLKLMRRFFKMC